MEKYNVTPEMLFVLKTLRLRSGLSSKELASRIDRSPSYLSKLEKGSIRKIPFAELALILENIIPSEADLTSRLSAVVKTYLSFYSRQSLCSQIWLLDADVIKREVPVPESLVRLMNEKLDSMGAGPLWLEDNVNTNRDSFLKPGVPPNEVLVLDIDGRKLPFMRIWLEPGTVSSILGGSSAVSRFYILQSMLFAVLRREHYADGELSMEDGRLLIRECAGILSEHGVVSCTDYLGLIDDPDLVTEHSSLGEAFNELSVSGIKKIVSYLETAASHDRVGASQTFDNLEKNLSWDLGFMMKLMGIKYYSLEDASYSLKKQFFTELERLLERYRSVGGPDRTIEKY